MRRDFREPAVVESTPALEIELLTRIALKGGHTGLASLFGRDNGVWPEPAPTWAMLAAHALVGSGVVIRHHADANCLIITEAGWVRLGRRRIPELQQ